MPLNSLEIKNIEHALNEYKKEAKVLEKYSNKRFFTIEEALDFVGDEIRKLEKEKDIN